MLVLSTWSAALSRKSEASARRSEQTFAEISRLDFMAFKASPECAAASIKHMAAATEHRTVPVDPMVDHGLLVPS